MTSTDSAIHWYVAYVKYCHEKRAASQLEALGVEYFLPIQKVSRKWSDRVKIVDRMVLPRLIFVRITFDERITLLEKNTSLLGYMTTHGTYTPIVVPDHQLEMFRFMVCHTEEDIFIQSEALLPGDHVHIMSGPLEGLECLLVKVDNRRCIAVSLGPIGNAMIEISSDKLEKIKIV